MTHPKVFLRKTCLLTFACTVLLSHMVIPTVRSKTLLDPAGIYGNIDNAKNCLSVVWNAANAELRGQEIANCLRMAFHDSGTYQEDTDEGGANGSVLRFEMNSTNLGPHRGLQMCAKALERILDRSRRNGCPETTVADAIQVTGAAAVNAAGGPKCRMLMGRPDADKADNVFTLPGPCTSVSGLIGSFRRMGFKDPEKALVVLSGAHTIGRSQETGKSTCSSGLGPLSSKPDNFNNKYYKELLDSCGNGTHCGGHFSTDGALAAPGAPTFKWVKKLAENNKLFHREWCYQYRENSLLGVDVKKVAGMKIHSGWDPKIKVSPVKPKTV